MKHALRIRSRLLQAARSFFYDRGFIEVETPVRVRAPALETHIDAEPSGDRWLRTSPELHMKRLLANGFERIFQIGPCFRRGEWGRLHHPEFTLLEWYRAGTDYLGILEDTRELLAHCARMLCGHSSLIHGGVRIDFGGEWLVLSVREAFCRWAGWDPVESWHEDRFHLDLVERIETFLPREKPCVLIDYPSPAGALARRKREDPRVAERWELYLAGMEIANAYSELTDPIEQRRRFETAAAERRARGREVYPIDEDFIAALERVPPCGGIALGFDRLVMLFTGANSIEDVIAFRE